MTSLRGATRPATSASPNALSKPQTLRSIVSCQRPSRCWKYPLTTAEEMRLSRAVAYSASSPPSPYPMTPMGACRSRLRASKKSTADRIF